MYGKGVYFPFIFVFFWCVAKEGRAREVQRNAWLYVEMTWADRHMGTADWEIMANGRI